MKMLIIENELDNFWYQSWDQIRDEIRYRFWDQVQYKIRDQFVFSNMNLVLDEPNFQSKLDIENGNETKSITTDLVCD